MRLKWFGFAAAAGCLMLIPSSSLADTLQLTSTPGQIVGGVYVYPYDFTVTTGGGSQTNVALMCLDYNLHITQGESWNVNIENIYAAAAAPGALETLDQFEEQAWLYSQMDGSNDTGVQLAVWAVNDSTDAEANAGWGSSNAASLLSEAESDYSSFGSSFYDQFLVYVPTADQGGSEGMPQSFMGPAPTPEPSSLALFGTGLLGAVGVLKRKMRKAQA